MSARGYFGIGIYHPKTEINVGTLWRTAHIFGASFLFTIGRRYKPQCSDTTKSWRHVPLWHFDEFEQAREALPRECRLVGIELIPDAIPLARFRQPDQEERNEGLETASRSRRDRTAQGSR